MIPPTQIAISGLQAAEKRLANSANNIANANTQDFIPQKLVQKSLAEGGVSVETQNVDPAFVEVPGDEGIVNLPNVSLEEQVVEVSSAVYDFKANLKVLESIDEMGKRLLDIIS